MFGYNETRKSVAAGSTVAIDFKANKSRVTLFSNQIADALNARIDADKSNGKNIASADYDKVRELRDNPNALAHMLLDLKIKPADFIAGITQVKAFRKVRELAVFYTTGSSLNVEAVFHAFTIAALTASQCGAQTMTHTLAQRILTGSQTVKTEDGSEMVIGALVTGNDKLDAKLSAHVEKLRVEHITSGAGVQSSQCVQVLRACGLISATRPDASNKRSLEHDLDNASRFAEVMNMRYGLAQAA
jgi:hypothetical protein